MNARTFPNTQAVEVTRQRHTLPDGRALSFARYGADDGAPVYYFHDELFAALARAGDD